MNRRLFAFLGVLLLVGVAFAGGGDLFDALLQRPHSLTQTRVVPDGSLRRWDPITLFFTSNRGPAAGPEDHPERYLDRLPKHPGAWTWLDRKTLQFRPAEPWTPMALVSLRVDGRSTEMFTLASPPLFSNPAWGSRGLDPFDTIELVFADVLPAETLARLTRIELRPLPGLSDEGLVVLDQDDFEIKMLERGDAKGEARYVLSLTEPVQRGTQVRLKLGLTLDTDAREAVSELVFSTSEPFRATQLGCSSAQLPLAPSGSRYAEDQPLACDGDRVLRVGFNAAPAGLNAVVGRNLVRFAPAVAGLAFETEGRTLRVAGRFLDGVNYRVELSAGAEVRDVAGRALQMKESSVAWVRFIERDPYVRWGAGAGVVERFGPKRVPIEGRRIGQVDLRVYKVNPKNREFWPFSAGSVVVNESERPPGPGEEPEPLATAAVVTHAQLRQRLRALGSPGFSALVDVGLEGAAARTGLDLSEAIQALSGEVGAGHFLVGVRRLDGVNSRDWMRVQVTDLALTTLETGHEVRFVVTSLATGKPVLGARIEVEGVVTKRDGVAWETLLSGKTDASGVFRWKAPGKGSVEVRRLVVSKGRDNLVLDAKHPPESFANARWSQERGGWLQWAFNDLKQRVEQPRVLAHLFSERPMYRPEEVVHLKGYVRRRYQGRLRAVSGKAELEVRAPGGATWKLPVTLSASGAFYAKWDQAEIPTGRYQVNVTHDGRRIAGTDFQVEAYRLPTFEVDLSTADNVLTVPNDQPFDVTAVASYYAGGKVALRPVSWTVSQFPYSWTPTTAGLDGFLFSSDGRFSRSGRFDSTPGLQHRAQTDRAGKATLSLDPGIEPTSQPRTYVIEAEVTGADEQTVTATHRVHAVPAFVLGLKVPRHLERAELIPIEAVALDSNGAMVSGRDLTVRLIQRQWHSVLQASDFSDGIARYVTDTVDVPIAEQRLKSADQAKKLSLPIDEPGVYIVELEARDALGRVQVVSVDLYAGGKGAVTWSKPEAGVFDVTPDRSSYQPGQTAKLVVRSPYQSGRALVVIEAPEGNLYKSVVIEGGKATVPVRIREGWVPKIPVHVLLRRGRLANAGLVGGSDLGKPETLGATRWLTIDPVENTVEVELEHPERAMPGETVPVTVRLRSPAGKPLSGEVTLWMVDQAVLALAPEKRLEIKASFLPRRVSRFRAYDTRNQVFGRLPFSTMPGGDGGEESADEDGVLDQTTVRKNFKSVPYYEPTIRVGASGQATVQVQLPDNLTVFKVRAKATSGTARFGFAKSSLRVRLPVLVQPDLPRFVRPGDVLEVAALGRVIEGEGGAGTAEIRVEGLQLQSAAKTAVTWDRDEAVRFAWPVTVPTPPASADGSLSRQVVSVTIGAKRADGAADAVQIELPLLDDRRHRSTQQVVELAAGATGELSALPEAARPGSLQRTIVLADHPGLVKMAAGTDVFLRRPARSTGQQLDRASAWIGLGALRSGLGLQGEELVQAAVAEALGWIPSVLDARGLVAAWPGGRGQVGLTAETLIFLEEARGAGYPVDEKLRTGLVRTLTTSLRSDYAYFLDGNSWLERSQALEALASAGAFAPGYFTELGENARILGPEGVAHILLAAGRAGKSAEPLAVALATKLEGEVVLGLFQGVERYRGLKSERSVRSTLIQGSEPRTLAVMTRSLGRAAPNAAKLPLMVDALVRLGGDDGWGGRADAPALRALAERLQQRSPSVVTVAAGPRTLVTDKGLASASLSTDQAVPLAHKGGPAGVLFATARYLPAQPGDQAEARNQGFVLSRDHALYVDGSDTPTRTRLDEAGRELNVPLGSVVEEHLQLVNPEDRTYIAIELPLAAGMELMNPNLATASSEAQPSKSNTQQATWVEFGDAGVTWYFEQLPKGTFDFYVRTRASTRGSFVQPPAVGEALYDGSITGNSPGARVIVQ